MKQQNVKEQSGQLSQITEFIYLERSLRSEVDTNAVANKRTHCGRMEQLNDNVRGPVRQ